MPKEVLEALRVLKDRFSEIEEILGGMEYEDEEGSMEEGMMEEGMEEEMDYEGEDMAEEDMALEEELAAMPKSKMYPGKKKKMME